MRSYSERNVFTPDAVVLYRDAARLVDLVPANDAYFQDLRAHELARAVGARLGVSVVDGHYGATAHSWLAIQCATRGGGAILDVYAVGRLPQVQIVDLHPWLPHAIAYEPRTLQIDIDEDMLDALASCFG